MTHELRALKEDAQGGLHSLGQAIALADRVESTLQGALVHVLNRRQGKKGGEKEMEKEDEGDEEGDEEEEECVECASEEEEEMGCFNGPALMIVK